MLKSFIPFSIGLIVMASACEGPEQRAAENDKASASADTSAMMQDGTVLKNADSINTIDHTGTAMMNDTANVATRPSAAVVKKGKAIVGTIDMDTKETIRMDKDGVYNRAEIMPSYPGGERALAKFVQDNIEYPQAAIDNSAEGKVILSFSVDEAGKIYTPKVVSGGTEYGLAAEALRVVKKMPNWNPGQIKGKNVKTKFTLPIDYQIN